MNIKNLLNIVIRFLIGGLFIFSGLIKLNDPVGTEIKMEEYFEVFANDFAGFFHYLIPYALEIGLFLVILEVVLGVAVLINYRMELTSKILFILIIFFTFLTFYSAYFNKVTDCGCFGDAIPLTPWQSFSKDVVLTILILHLFWYRKRYSPLTNVRTGNIITGSVTVVCLVLGIYAVEHLPYIDFRPYKVGDSIPANMLPKELPVGEYTFIKDGKKIKSEQYLPESFGYIYVSYEIINPKESIPKITDYNLWNPDVGDYTAESFKGRKLFFITVDAAVANTKSMDKISSLIKELEGEGIVSPMVITSSNPSVIEVFRHEYQLAIPYFFSDATVIKAMIRSNPGIMVLEDGVVKGKWHYNDIPALEEVQQLFD